MADSNFANYDQITTDLFGSSASPAVQKEGVLIQSLMSRYNRVVQNKLVEFADSLPYADASITADLTQAANLLVEKEWHRLKNHWDDVKNAKDAFNELWSSIETYFRKLPVTRVKPVAAAASFADDSTLLKNIPGLTDSAGNIISSS